MSISQLAKNLHGSEIIKIAGEINELKRQGQNIANLTIGDFDSNIYPIPAELKQGIIDAYNDNQTNYPPADGILALRENVSGFLKSRYNLEYGANQILVSGGSRPLIYSTFLAVVDPGDKVIFPTPSWNNNHYSDLTSANAVMIETRAENNFMPTADEIAPHIKGAALLALCSPLNPTGTMFSKKDLEEICDLVIAENKTRAAGQKPLYLLYDQIYSQLTFGVHRHYDPVSLRPELKDYTIFIDGGSKCFAATGVRVGWGFGPAHVINSMKAIVGHMGAWSPKAEQVAMAKYLANDTYVNSYLAELKGNIQASLNTLHTGFQQLKAEGFKVDSIEPMGAIYLTIKVDYTGSTTPDGTVLKNSTDINFYLIKEAKVAFVPFSAFGTDDSVNWFRASVGAITLQDVEALVPRVKAALAKLK
jgi:aspartate aminotransferase